MKHVTRIRRKGAIAPLAALLMISILCFAAFVVDIGWITLTAAHLQNVSDSAAEAAACELLDASVIYNLPTQTLKASVLGDAEQNAIRRAQEYALYNRAGDVKTMALRSVDVHFGSSNQYGQFSGQHVDFPNSVELTMRRDGNANGPLKLFFAPMFGQNATSLTASAAATIYTGNVVAFDGNLGKRGLLLPVALDVNVWKQFFVNGNSPDGVLYQGPSGAAKLKVSPSPDSAAGNCGLLCIGRSTIDEMDFRNWIINGPSGADVQYLSDVAATPLGANNPKPWIASPGIGTGYVSSFSGIANKRRLLALFTPISQSPYQAAGGSGSKLTYNIVGFVGVVVTDAYQSGSDSVIFVQPRHVSDATAIYDKSSIVPAGTTVDVITTGPPPKLSSWSSNNK